MNETPPAAMEANVDYTTPVLNEYTTTVVNGYLFWGPIALVIAVTELLAVGGVQRAIEWILDRDITIPWPTISTTIGHLQDVSSPVAALVVAVIAAVAFHALTYRKPGQQTRQGRVMPRDHSEPKPLRFYNWKLGLFLTALAVIPGFWAAYSNPENKYLLAYLIYGAFLVYGVLIPSTVVYLSGKEAQFPTLFFTFRSLRDLKPWIGKALGAGLAAGLAVLVLHLALYPWPNITNDSNRYAGLKAGEARRKAVNEINDLGTGSKLLYSTQTRGIDRGGDAWLVYFIPAEGSGLEYSGCSVAVTEKATKPTPECSTPKGR
jgi:hypothetical protein